MAKRLEAFLERLDRMSLGDLQVLSLPEPDPDERADLLERVAKAARFAGADRTAEIDEARQLVSEVLFRRFAQAGLNPTWAGVNWAASSYRADDRVRLILAAQDSAVADVLDDVLPKDDLAALRAPFAVASSMEGAGISGAPDVQGRSTGLRASATTAGMIALMGGLPGWFAALAGLLGRRRRRLEKDD